MSNASRKPIIAGNWKMYKTLRQTCEFLEAFCPMVADATHAEIVVCPTAVNLEAAVRVTNGSAIQIGGQNLHWAKEGAYTGEVSGDMLKAIGVEWVLVAHSERRLYCGETDFTASKKLAAALETGLKPIYCVGEVLEERMADQTHEILARQFEGGTEGLTAEQFAKMAIAYEPVWAIGTGKVATPQIACDAHHFIRSRIEHKYGAEVAQACRILYGGSVKPDNVKGLMAEPEIDGALVGGASLDPASFAAIVNY